MKITIEGGNGPTVTLDAPDIETLSEVIDVLVIPALVAHGFQRETIDDYIREAAADMADKEANNEGGGE